MAKTLKQIRESHPQALEEKWNEKMSLKYLETYRKMYKFAQKARFSNRNVLKELEQLYDKIVLKYVYGKEGANIVNVKTIDGKKRNW